MPDRPAPTIRTSTCSACISAPGSGSRLSTRGVRVMARSRSFAKATISTSCPICQHLVESIDSLYDGARGSHRRGSHRAAGARPAQRPHERRRARTRHLADGRRAPAGAFAERYRRRRSRAGGGDLAVHLLLLLPLQGRCRAHAHRPHGRGGGDRSRRGSGPARGQRDRRARRDLAAGHLRNDGSDFCSLTSVEFTPTRLADGIVRLGTPYVNWYLVSDGSAVTVVDAGVPGYRPQLEPGLGLLGHSLADVRAVLLTHSDGDHTGVAPAIRDETGAPIHLHPDDAEAARNRGAKKTDESMLAELLHPGTYRLFWEFGRNGGMRPPVVDNTVAIADGQELDVPGRPRVIHTPGHTPGHVAYHFARAGALFV